mgnify:CR=1 FL=1
MVLVERNLDEANIAHHRAVDAARGRVEHREHGVHLAHVLLQWPLALIRHLVHAVHHEILVARAAPEDRADPRLVRIVLGHDLLCQDLLPPRLGRPLDAEHRTLLVLYDVIEALRLCRQEGCDRRLEALAVDVEKFVEAL